MITKEYTYRLDTIETVAKRLLQSFNSKVILFNGEMGAGKTTLIKSLLKVMGSDDAVTSPTFSIVNEYSTYKGIVYHFDFYRIEDEEEAHNFGVEDYFESNNLLFIEWSERVASLLPKDVCIVDISINSPKERTLKLTINTHNLTENTHAIS
ncbi:tRNA (adenosine(37)-N6)-threonylcarbamoyltransferase complex ATPase subunit type 1 TsaE [Winogradskyella litorisediminis]|uniref:tRNA threonylcarbamoyladenosine biosynthesis protein TsaE n=1 Tax=Winogradskyella litorisediminis TaxID=1156618 RepID=A0ABW3N4D4_9FLAO